MGGAESFFVEAATIGVFDSLQLVTDIATPVESSLKSRPLVLDQPIKTTSNHTPP